MAINLFQQLGRPDEQLHPSYLTLRDAPAYAPARALLRELQETFEDPDGNFVEQFQTTGLDSRTFEFFLDTLFKAEGHQVNRAHARPDFLLTKDGVKAAVEAVVAATPTNEGIQPYFAMPAHMDLEVTREYLRHNVPVRLGSPLFTKLNQRYWELPHVAGLPLVIAIQDFHEAGSLSRSGTSLSRYLYGLEQHWYQDANGQLVITEQAIDFHRVGAKEVPSGFFKQPGAENVSAVLFSNSGTIPKFVRMGQEGAHRSDAVRILRWGACYRHDPNATLPAGFVYEVGDPEQGKESWREGTVLMHNPHALHPLPIGWLGASVDEELENGSVTATLHEPFHPYFSFTQLYSGNASPARLQREVDVLSERLARVYPP